jgi:sigma-B regulation protein RsbU (phosphoserine phosphatase)
VAGRSALPDYEALFHTAPCGYLVTDATGRIVLANQTLLDWLGQIEGEVVGQRSFVDLLTGGGRIYHETHYRPTLQIHGEAHEIALDLVAADRTRIPVLISSTIDQTPEHHGLVRTIVFKAADRRAYEQEILRQRQRAEESERRTFVVAQALQRMLYPPEPPRIDGLDVGAAFRPAGDGGMIGGDFYDVFELESRDWLIAVGDVCGKGVEAAAVAGLARFTVRASAVHSRQLDEVMHQVNDVLLADESDRFVTLLLARFTRASVSWQATLARGGHPPPYRFRGDEPPVALGLPGGLVGAMEQVRYRHVDVPLEPGDLVLMYSDGLTEGRRGVEFYGEDRMLDHVAAHLHLSSGDLAHSLVDDVVAFQDGRPTDDIAVVTLRVG